MLSEEDNMLKNCDGKSTSYKIIKEKKNIQTKIKIKIVSTTGIDPRTIELAERRLYSIDHHVLIELMNRMSIYGARFQIDQRPQFFVGML